MKPFVTKAEIKAESSTTGHYVHVDQVNTNEQRMDSASDYKFIYSTPHISRKNDEIQGSAGMTAQSRYSDDSGFSDRTFDSTWTSSAKDTTRLFSSELEAESCRRLALKACKFSPIKRGCSSSIQPFENKRSFVRSSVQQRRLEFNVSDLQPSSFQLSQVETCNQETEEHVRSEETDSLSSKEAESVRQAKPSVIFYSYQSRSSSCSPHSINADDLEVSLQEMALEESPSPVSSKTSPVCLNSANCNSGWQHCYGDGEASQLWPSSKEIKTIPKFCKFHHQMSDSCLARNVQKTYLTQASRAETQIFNSSHSSSKELGSPNVLDLDSLCCRADAKLMFLKKLSLTPANSEPQKLTCDTISAQNRFRKSNIEYATAAHEIFIGDEIISNGDSLPTFSDFRVPPLPNKNTSPQNMVNWLYNCDFAAQCNVDNHKQFSFNHRVHKSPSKRSSVCEEDCCLLFSPTKVRKTDGISDTGEGRVAVVRSLQQNASRKNLNENGDCSLILDSGFTKVDFQHSQHYSDSLDLPPQTSTEASGTNKNKLEEKNTLFKKEFTESTASRSHLYSRNYCCQVEKEVTPCDTLNIVDRVAANVQKVIKKFIPPEPTHLIGRNVGLKYFDIIQELYCQNIQLCLDKIFQHVGDADLVSIAGVSIFWKLAMCNDHKAYNRYRQHKRNLSRTRVQQGNGKENCGVKPLDAPSDQSLTQSRGLLSSMQSQAKRMVVHDLPTTAPAKDTLMSDDMLKICPHCQGPAVIKHHQDRAICMSVKCCYDFCTLCFSSFHHPRQCKPLCKATSKGDVAGTRKSKKNLKRL